MPETLSVVMISMSRIEVMLEGSQYSVDGFHAPRDVAISRPWASPCRHALTLNGEIGRAHRGKMAGVRLVHGKNRHLVRQHWRAYHAGLVLHVRTAMASFKSAHQR